MTQPAILAPTAPVGRFLTLGLTPEAPIKEALQKIKSLQLSPRTVIGVGEPLLGAAGCSIPGVRSFPALSGPGGVLPSTQGALWISLGGEDPGALLHSARSILSQLDGSFRVDEDIASFLYDGGKDLSGYEDGTENPRGERAAEVALLSSDDASLRGGSFVAVQRWVHDLPHFSRKSKAERDQVIGREQESNEELQDAPSSAHVKRSAQESFSPEAFMLRRSMPWGDVRSHGLYFVAFGASLDPFERVMRRMLGLEDGIVGALFRFTRPVTGGYYWCPPLGGGRLVL